MFIYPAIFGLSISYVSCSPLGWGSFWILPWPKAGSGVLPQASILKHHTIFLNFCLAGSWGHRLIPWDSPSMEFQRWQETRPTALGFSVSSGFLEGQHTYSWSFALVPLPLFSLHFTKDRTGLLLLFSAPFLPPSTIFPRAVNLPA